MKFDIVAWRRRLTPFYEEPGDGGGTGGSGGGDGGTGGDGGAGGQGGKAPEIDYDKLAEVVAGKQRVAEDTVLRNYFKEQGLSKDEITEAIKNFKDKKAAESPDANKLAQDLKDANAKVVAAKIEAESLKIAPTLGIDAKTMSYVLKMADIKDVIVDGEISNDKLKEALEKVIEDVPQLKPSGNGSGKGGINKVGGDGGNDDVDEKEAALRRAFGLGEKK